MNILLVDDSKTMRNIQKNALASLGGATFIEAGDGLEALNLITQGNTFDLGLIDWNMPNMNGLELVTKIRERDRKTPLIMVTTEAEKQRVIDAIRAGASNYMIKPFTAAALLEKVQQTLEKAKAAA